jgi:hypothetical protein
MAPDTSTEAVTMTLQARKLPAKIERSETVEKKKA